MDLERRVQIDPEALDANGDKAPETADFLTPHCAKVIGDSIRWRLSKLKPSEFGDSVNVAHSIDVTVAIGEQAPPWLAAVVAGPSPVAGLIDATPSPPTLDVVVSTEEANIKRKSTAKGKARTNRQSKYNKGLGKG